MAEDFSEANAPYGYESGTNTPITKENYDKAQNQQLINSGHGIYAEQQPYKPQSEVNFNNANVASPINTAPTADYSLKDVGSTDVTMGVNKAIQEQNMKPAVETNSTSKDSVQQPVQTSGSEISYNTDPRNSAFNMYEGAVQSQLQGAKNAALAQEAFYTQKSQIDEQQKVLADAKQAAFDVDWDKKTKEYDDTLSEMKAASNDKVIPGSYLARQDTSGSLATGIAVALGAFAATAAGTSSNLGIEMINKAIDRDIEAQKFNIENKFKNQKAELESQNTLLGRMKDKYSDDKSAALATRALMLDSVENKMRLQLAKTSLPLEAQAKAQEQMANIKMKRIESLAQLKANEMQLQARKDAMGGANNEFELTPTQAVAVYGEKEAEKYVNGFGRAYSKEDKKQFQENYGDSKMSLDTISSILTSDLSKISPTDRAKMATELNLLTGKMRLAVLGPGAMTEKEFDRLIETLGDPNAIFAIPGTQMTKLKTVKNRLQAQQDTLVKQYFGKQTFDAVNRPKTMLKYSK